MDEREKAVEAEKAAEKRHEEKVTQRQMNLDAKCELKQVCWYFKIDLCQKHQLPT